MDYIMIDLRVDECFAFDYLSILYIKMKKDPSSEKTKSYNECLEHIKTQIKDNHTTEILESKEYLDLINANEKTFISVDMAKKDLVPASHVDSCNYRRFLCKQNLQNKFFMDNRMVEEKIGY